jgi:metal-dependent amidase/aminoacylase/carboxypeptidase family protein
MAVPAEEAVEVEWRLQLRREGKIEFLGGKQELIRLGVFDDVDLALITHSSGRPETRKLELGGTNNGHLIKQIRYIGKAAHAGSSPHLGINALKAAMIGLTGIDAQRETFRDEDTIRVHPIITKGGESVNAVPDDVRIETYIRGARLEAIGDANVKVDRSLRAGALALGARVEITTVPGYLPLVHDPLLAQLFETNAIDLVGSEDVTHAKHGSYCTDTGDLSHVVRLAHPFAGGATGVHHSAAFAMTDPDLAIINPAKVMAMCVVDLLRDGASSGREMLAAGPAPRFTKEEYLEHLRSMAYDRSYDGAADQLSN